MGVDHTYLLEFQASNQGHSLTGDVGMLELTLVVLEFF